LKDFLKNLIHQKNGPLTRELELAPSELGLGYLPQRLLPQNVIRSICGFCSTGCSLDIHIKDHQAVNLTPTLNYPVNPGTACPKGWEALTPLKASDRATTPLLRNKEGKLEPVDWHTAMEKFVNHFMRIKQTYGNESIAFLSTGQIPMEEMAFLGCLTKFGMGFIHGDSNTRQCMATSAVAYKQSFGFDAPPYTYKDLEESDVLVFIGANPCIAHPIMWERVERNPHDPQILVVDPRKTETAMRASKHYAIEPKSDLVLLYGLAHILIEEKWIKEDFIRKSTSDFENFKAHVKAYTPEKVSEATGLSRRQIYEFASAIHLGKAVSFWWTMGVNQSYEGVRTAQAIINLALMTENIGRPGTGANSITGQCNAMGSRLFSNTTTLLGGRDFLNPDHRRRIAQILEIDPAVILQQNSWAYDQIVEGIVSKKIKGLWVIATNPLHSWINQNQLKDYLNNLEFLVVQDMYFSTETARSAHLILPAAGWGEKEGTFINSERRIGVIRKASKPPGEALPDFDIFKMIAQYWGCERMFSRWSTPEAVFQILKEISRNQPCDITGIKDYAMLERCGGIQWPCPEGSVLKEKERRLFEDGKFFHSDGKARFYFEIERPLPEVPDKSYPFFLLTGRGTSSQWHTQTRTGKSAILRKMYPQNAYVEINDEDARSRGIVHGEQVYVSSLRGKVRVQAFIVTTLKPGQMFMPMHYEETNQLTLGTFDPYSRQPSYKACAADVSRFL